MKESILKTADARILKKYQQIKQSLAENSQLLDEEKLDRAFNLMFASVGNAKDITGQSVIQSALDTAEIAIREIGLGNASLKSIFLHRASLYHSVKNDDITKEYGASVATIFSGLEKISYITVSVVW